jgi:hypothetical protein
MARKLQNVYWIGGGSGAGKSTIARSIAAQHGLNVYSTDDMMADHARRSSPENCPLLHAFIAMDLDERWVNRSPEVMLETFHWFQGEGFERIVEDLLRCRVRTASSLRDFGCCHDSLSRSSVNQVVLYGCCRRLIFARR